MRSLLAAIALMIPVLAATPALAGEVAVADLVADGAAHAGSEVTVVGEFVGDYGHRRGGFTWTQLNGDGYAQAPIVDGGALVGSNVGIGVRMPSALAKGLDAPGRYRTVGPLVRVTGVWKYHDPQRQGETYLDVTAIEIVEPGRVLHEPPQWSAYALGLVLLAIGGVVLLGYRRKRDEVV